ncbi:tRNA synthetases class I-domain-containing protein [Melampsora americana]|nr:tRNA synthetases class I-domain-containing protein [Melampsora americana]
MTTNPELITFPDHDPNAPFSFPLEEEKVLEYWKSIDAFKTSLAQSKLELDQGTRTRWNFYDGPPFATGLPHYGHLLMGTVKDIVTRFAHADGHYVERRFGWDCHGLPVEHEIDKKLQIKSKDDVMKIGIEAYNAECRSIVMRYSSEWRSTIERMGRWIDFDNDYKTLNVDFMESIWWVFKQLWTKGQVYRASRVMPYSTSCTTPLSNFEAGSDYRDVNDPAVTVSFPLLDDPDTCLLAWTTTPWTLPSNLALCVHPKLTYIKIFDETHGKHFIICDKLLTTLYKDPKKAKYKKVASYLGSELEGWKYEPLFPYFYQTYQQTGFKVVTDTYVTSDSGTGIVHQAPAFGAEDHEVCKRHGVVPVDSIPPCPLDDSGRFTSEVPEFEGQHVKEADPHITKYLKNKGRVIVQSQIKHSYPFCWRSGTPLIYRAIPAWFVRVQPIVDRLVENNKKTRWVPASVGENRFQSWLANARDWNISRNRYWGTPLPIWVSDDYEEQICVGSIDELDELSGCGRLKDLHRETIDKILIPSKQGKGYLKRVDEVFDCWFESGSMPYAQVHYPFENKETFESAFPAQFIAEGMDQTRGWFYTLLVLSTHLFQKAPWQNLVVCGLVLAEDGKKMSKSLKNYPNPDLIINQHGADPLRLFLINSPVVRGENLRFREAGVKEVVGRVMLPWLNSYRFFLGQVSLLKKMSKIDFVYDHQAKLSENVMDRWVLARCQALIKSVRTEMEAYRLYTVVPQMLDLVDELTNWYIRFNRRRLKGENGVEDAVVALNTLFETLFTLCRTLSSFTPFLTENIYQGLRKFFPKAMIESLTREGNDLRSIHFLSFPIVRDEFFDSVIVRRMKRMQAVINLGRTIRERKTISLKTPLKELVIFHNEVEYLEDVKMLENYVKDELNLHMVTYSSDEEACGVKYKAAVDWTKLGKRLKKEVALVKKGLSLVSSEMMKEYMKSLKIEIGGIEVIEGELIVSRFVEGIKLGDRFESNTDEEVVVLLDCEISLGLEYEGFAREMMNRIQRLRKKAGAIQTDDLDVFYQFEIGSTEAQMEYFENVLKSQKEVILRVLRNLPLEDSQRDLKKEVLIEEVQEKWNEFSIRFILVKS